MQRLGGLRSFLHVEQMKAKVSAIGVPDQLQKGSGTGKLVRSIAVGDINPEEQVKPLAMENATNRDQIDAPPELPAVVSNFEQAQHQAKLDGMATKTHNSTNATAHGSPTIATHRSPSAGSYRPRGSSKRTQIQKAKKNHLDANDLLTMELAATGSAAEERLAAAIRTKRLDFSLPRESLAPPEPTVFQIFPAVIVDHVKQGHLLIELWLTNHHIGSLPAEIAVLTKLRVLGLAGNALTALPAELCQLTALESLYLERNRLQTLPTRVAFPPQLRELRLDNNQLSVFPAQITKLRLLNRLGLSHNQLKVLPEEIYRLRNLVELNLDYNRLDAEFPEGFAALQRLERLGLEGNLLAERPVILDRSPVLLCVRLSGNRAKIAVPRRHDGYFQCVESCAVAEDDPLKKTDHRSLEGLVPCRDQNLLNMMGYEIGVSQTGKPGQ